jgi:Raf kinase inhibitor-like YbhB/YbcL family protein/uncharacterized protein (TIGR00297 family)
MSLLLQSPSLALLVIGFFFALLIAYLAFRAHALNRSGALAAAALGTVIFGLGGLPWAVLLLAFFISSSTLSRAFSRRKQPIDEKYAKGSRRDAGQVLANGGAAGVFVLLYLVLMVFQPESPLITLIWLAFASSLAAANADTWATELGVLNPGRPVMINTGRQVEAGTSGAVSPAGLLAALAGSSLIAALAWLMVAIGWGLRGVESALLSWQPYLLVALAGLVGSLVDSLLGATLQAIYTCPACQKETERHPTHSCGSPTTLKRGLSWLDNDAVNAACTASAALLALMIGLLILPGTARVVSLPMDDQGESLMPVNLSISAFSDGGAVPKEYTCDGANRSPEITWGGVPSTARSLALIVDDPDAPVGTFTHWVLYNLPPGLTGLPAGQPQAAVLAGVGTQGANSFGNSGYDGPCPPAGKAHRYYFRLYALDIDPTLPAGMNSARLQKAMQGYILAQGEWMGTYHR